MTAVVLDNLSCTLWHTFSPGVVNKPLQRVDPGVRSVEGQSPFTFTTT